MPKAKQIYTDQEEMAIMADLADPRIADDPFQFVMYAFPWGVKGTPLEHQTGPRKWQVEVLTEIRDHLAQQKLNGQMGEDMTMFREAVASGRGIGKSALVAWLVLWMMSTRLGATVVVAANTEAQLTSRTWAELGKWHTMATNAHWFDRNAMSLRPAEWFDELLKSELKIDTGYYYAQAQLWSEEKPDAFAGVHNHAGIFVIYDEASGIPQAIWTVTQGFFTEPVLNRYWMAFSNPRNNTGAFFECFHKFRDVWRRKQIDSRSVEGVDRAFLQQLVDQFGPDSDEARVEVLGQFPNQGDMQLIPMDSILGAREREIIEDKGAPLLMGVDYGNGGKDPSVIRFRRGFDARTIPAIRKSGKEVLDFTANYVVPAIEEYNPDAIMLDTNGVGAPGAEYLRALGYRVISVYAQGSAKDDNQYFNKRIECWGEMAIWLRNGAIDSDEILKDDLKGPQYKWHKTSGKKQLESKDDMKARGLASPNDGDALSITFGQTVARKDHNASRHKGRNTMARNVEFNLHG